MQSLIAPRLLLREWEEKDAGFLLDMYSRPEVKRHLVADSQVLRDEAEALAMLERWRARQDEAHGVWAVQDRATGHLVGTALLLRMMLSGSSAVADETEIGWHLHPDAWGRGYATEAAVAVLAYAARSSLTGVYAVTGPDDSAARAVCRRLGMRHLGTTDRYYDQTCELYTTLRE
ncbi:GNAT family N-acetyltransferase [Actinoplanes sp. NBRC 101535]|uniref:GNAT family N-acetyltransferase n=1 Tax=Actinoplanes sp. NBRC 101535 TaxID=3032196 RepID=UPI0024A3991F|nr:GNAT family N-acetyltransferase [Actinoplanes sp. NBRC 101535]GLX99652.1 N-acetyltransferase [Actinoplanes sp. NBRC 101535]